MDLNPTWKHGIGEDESNPTKPQKSTALPKINKKPQTLGTDMDSRRDNSSIFYEISKHHKTEQ